MKHQEPIIKHEVNNMSRSLAESRAFTKALMYVLNSEWVVSNYRLFQEEI